MDEVTFSVVPLVMTEGYKINANSKDTNTVRLQASTKMSEIVTKVL